MALVKCPECGHEVSDKAIACPSCAYPLHQVAQPVQVRNTSINCLANFALFVLICAIVVGAYYGLWQYLVYRQTQETERLYAQALRLADKLRPWTEELEEKGMSAWAWPRPSGVDIQLSSPRRWSMDDMEEYVAVVATEVEAWSDGTRWSIRLQTGDAEDHAVELDSGSYRAAHPVAQASDASASHR